MPNIDIRTVLITGVAILVLVTGMLLPVILIAWTSSKIFKTRR